MLLHSSLDGWDADFGNIAGRRGGDIRKRRFLQPFVLFVNNGL